MTDEEFLSAGLAEVLLPELGPVEIEQLRRLTGGANRETWSFNAVTDAGQKHELILQRDRAGVERLAGGCFREAEVVRRAAQHGVPVAQVMLTGDTPNPLGRSFSIARRISGETIGRRILRDEQWEQARASFVTDCAEALARIHNITPEDLDGIDLIHVPDSLSALLDTYLAFDDPHPAFDLALRWLELNRPPPLGTCLVHGDFRLGNLMIDSNGLAAALDWEITHTGDPGEDLGWLCVRAWRFGGPEPVGGIGGYDEFLTAYQQAGGVAVDRDTLLWWEIYGTVRWGVICMQLSGDFRAGRTNSVEMATIGRRIVENEYDVMALLG